MSKGLVLVTGGAGYIGSHTVVELLEANYSVIVVDNLCNSSPEALKRVEEITGKQLVAFYKTDIRDQKGLEQIFEKHPGVSAVVHFAGLKAVGESCAQPLMYYENNVGGTVSLLNAMKKHNVKNLVFSSSATVYGELKENFPSGGLYEELPGNPNNPYGRTKFMIEEILKDYYASDKTCNFIILRYFNPVGAHPSGKIGEDPNGIPNNLMPYITQVLIGKLPQLSVYGNDYPTKDGTGVRDYIHVVDLAQGHIAAVAHLEKNPGCVVYNLGTGNGCSVMEIISGMEKATGKQIPHKIVARRPGDAAMTYARPDKAKQELGWSAKYTLDDVCRDAWNWQTKNPNGYRQ